MRQGRLFKLRGNADTDTGSSQFLRYGGHYHYVIAEIPSQQISHLFQNRSYQQCRKQTQSQSGEPFNEYSVS